MGILSVFKVLFFIFFVLLDMSSASETNIDTEVECCLNEWQCVELRHYDDVASKSCEVRIEKF